MKTETQIAQKNIENPCRDVKMNKAEKVIKRLQKENETFTIKILEDKKNRENGFGILLNAPAQTFSSTNLNEYYGIKKSTLKLLDEAEIKDKILK